MEEGRQIAPKRSENLPKNAKWLSGDGGGVWFFISNENLDNNKYQIKRFTPEGILNCDRIFVLEESKHKFDIKEPYEFIHISHCAKCRILQNEVVFTFIWKK